MNYKKIGIFKIITILLLASCGNNKKVEEQTKPDIYGHWLLESLLNHADSAKSILGHKQFFCSEIIISKNSDSVTIVNGDYEYWKTKSDSISPTEISLAHLSHMPHSNLYLIDNNKLMYYDSAARKPFYYIKSKTEVSDSVNIDFPMMKSEITQRLFTGNFVDLKLNKKVKFLPNYKTKGLLEYADYEIFINNETADQSESNLLLLKANKNKKVEKKFLIWQFQADTLKLFTTINTECKECKPFYEKGVIWKTLLKK